MVLFRSSCAAKLLTQRDQMFHTRLGKHAKFVTLHAMQYVRTLSTPRTYVVYPGAYSGALSHARLLLGSEASRCMHTVATSKSH
jgi:hypothetical protein